LHRQTHSFPAKRVRGEFYIFTFTFFLSLKMPHTCRLYKYNKYNSNRKFVCAVNKRIIKNTSPESFVRPSPETFRSYGVNCRGMRARRTVIPRFSAGVTRHRRPIFIIIFNVFGETALSTNIISKFLADFLAV
jgi:hypothetical protein